MTTVDQEGKQVNEHALVALKGFLDSVEPGVSGLDALFDMIEEVVPLKPIPLAHSSKSTDRNALERALQISSDMEEASDLAKRMSVILGEQAKAAKIKFEAITWREGISSLPDDVLSYVLSYATRPDDLDPYAVVESGHEVDTIYEAINLSHVCSRFRSLILNNPRIWNFLSDQFTNADMVTNVIKNAKSAPLAVYVDRIARIRAGTFERIISACLTASARWESLTFGEFYTTEDEEIWKPQDFWNNAEAFSRLTRGCEFPVLKYLAFHYTTIPVTIHLRDEKLHPYLHWTLPSLRNFNFSGGIPLPFENRVPEVGICCRHQRGDVLVMHQLQTFLASCAALRRISLQFMGWKSVIPCNCEIYLGVECVDFHFDNCTMNVVRRVWSALNFQDVKRMSLMLDIPSHEQDREVLDLPDWGILFEELLLQHSYVTLECLDLELEPHTVLGTRAPFLPPFAKLPNLRHLKLTCLHWPSIKLLDVPEVIPPLRSLTLMMDMGDWEHVSEWVVGLVRRLKAQGDLDAFELLQINDPVGDFPEPPGLKGEIHAYLPTRKIVIKTWPYYDERFD